MTQDYAKRKVNGERLSDVLESERHCRLLMCALVSTLEVETRLPMCKEVIRVAELYADNRPAWQEEILKLSRHTKDGLKDSRLSPTSPYAEAKTKARHIAYLCTLRVSLVADLEATIRIMNSEDWYSRAIPVYNCVAQERLKVVVAPVVKVMASEIYDNKAFHMMPLLGDCMEDNGIENQDMLEHARSGCPHYKGCFVLDTLID